MNADHVRTAATGIHRRGLFVFLAEVRPLVTNVGDIVAKKRVKQLGERDFVDIIAIDQDRFENGLIERAACRRHECFSDVGGREGPHELFSTSRDRILQRVCFVS